MNLRKLALISITSWSSYAGAADTDSSVAVTDHYAVMAFNHYQSIVDHVVLLKKAVDGFVLNPTEQNHKAAKEAWIASRIIYGPSEVYRFYQGPIDHDDFGIEGLVNAWPLDEMYIDGTGSTVTGIIDDPNQYPVISKQLILSVNELGGEKNIASGFHAIEFLLWGVDRHADSAGQRPIDDYIGGRSPYALRRGEYLQAATELMVDHFIKVRDQWDIDQSGNYRSRWQLTSQKVKLTRMMTGMARLVYGELAGERLFTAVDEGDQEHEQSCFSDMSHLDSLGNLIGAENIYRGQLLLPVFQTPHHEDFVVDYSIDAMVGPSLRDYLDSQSPDLVADLDQKFAGAQSAVKSIPVPFDQAIIFSQEKVLAAVNALRSLGLAITEAGAKLGLDIDVGGGDGD